MAIVSRHLYWNVDREREMGPPAVLKERKERSVAQSPLVVVVVTAAAHD